jgi:hypothetical protein
MRSTLREFLASRRSGIKAEIAALRRELQEIDAAERAISGTAQSSPAPATVVSVAGGLSIKDKILAVLRDCPEGGDVATIIDLIQQQFGETIVKSSLSPQLSRLKGEGRVVTEHKIWRLAANTAPNVGLWPLKENEPPAPQGEDGSEDVEDQDAPTSPSAGSNLSPGSGDR